MSDDEVDPELLELLRKSLGITSSVQDEVSHDTGDLRDAEFIYDNAIDVSIDMYGTKAAAASIYEVMQQRQYSTEAWSQHELHPKLGSGFDEIGVVNFVFTMDLLNFSFWSKLSEDERFQVEYRGQLWTGYQSLVASLRRALDDGVPITTPRFWRSAGATDEVLRNVFRSATAEEMPLLEDRIRIFREAGDILHESFCDPDELEEEQYYNGSPQSHDQDVLEESKYNLESAADPEDVAMTNTGEETTDAAGATIVSQDPPQRDHTTASETQLVERDTNAAAESESAEAAKQGATTSVHTEREVVPRPSQSLQPDLSIVRLIEKADKSAGKLVNLLATHFPSFRDEARFDGRRVRFMKRAQIFVADLWAALNGRGYGEFHDIGHLTMFADYRVPQMLSSLDVLNYSPPLDHHIRNLKDLESGHSWEVQLRGCSIWAVELMRREIVRNHPDAEVNAVLIDFFLYDLAKERETVQEGLGMPHHRTRSIWY